MRSVGMPKARGLANVTVNGKNDLLGADHDTTTLGRKKRMLQRPALKDIAIKEEQS